MKPLCGCWIALILGVMCPGGLQPAPPVDESLLPSPASIQVDFSRDIQPLLAEHCLRCHGPERPKSGFRLTDRASALQGGDYGVDILPGQSAQSPLIHYVARVVEDMEMPPAGRGTPLSSNQVALLRAWIDQGVAWEDPASAEAYAPTSAVVPAFGWVEVRGDAAKFRELEWRPEGWAGGLEEFHYHQPFQDGRDVLAKARLLRDDYRFSLDWRQSDLGYARIGFKQFRKYYDDAGGYDRRFSPSLHRLGQDLYLDLSRAWVEVGLRSRDWLSLVAGYEYLFKDGTKSMQTWGPVQARSGNVLDARSMYPSAKRLDEDTHRLRLDVSVKAGGFELENKLRVQLSDVNTRRADALNVPYGTSTPDRVAQVMESHRSTHLADAVSLRKEIAPWWLAGVGYRYSWLNGESDFRLHTQDASGRVVAGNAWSADSILLHEVWQIANGYSQFRPLPNLTATLALQGQWKWQDHFGNAALDLVLDPADPTSGIIRFPAAERSTLDQTAAEENVLLRYTGLPYTALFGEVKLKQEDYRRAALQDNGLDPFQLTSDVAARWQEYRLGFQTSPGRLLSWGGHYRRRFRQTDYDYPLAQRNGAYPGFIRARRIAINEFEARLALRPADRLKTTLTYQYTESDYHTTTEATSPSLVGQAASPGGSLYAGHYQAHAVRLHALFTPIRHLSLSGSLSYQWNRTVTASHGSPSVAPYQGHLWSVLAGATYVVTRRTDLAVNYVFSAARYAPSAVPAGLTLGLDYARHGVQVGLRHRLGKFLTGRLQYAYFSYTDSSVGNLQNYRAHQVMAFLTMSWR